MEWEKAKNVIIFFLIACNILLGGLIYTDELKYTLNDERIDNITELLNKKNIYIETPLILKYNPMKKLELSVLPFEDKEIIKMFFIEGAEPKNTRDVENPVYETETEVVYINQNTVIYENEIELGKKVLTIDEAVKACDSFILNMGDKGKGYELDVYSEEVIEETEESTNMSKEIKNRNANKKWIFEYRQRIGSTIINDNQLLFEVDEHGIGRIEYSNSLPIGYLEDSREISSVDEVLFTFMVNNSDIRQYDKITIDKIDLIYFKEDASVSENKVSAIPAYRFYYTIYTENEIKQEKYLINAYTSNVIEGF